MSMDTLKRKFTSGNGIAVSRAFLDRAEFEAIVAEFDALTQDNERLSDLFEDKALSNEGDNLLAGDAYYQIADALAVPQDGSVVECAQELVARNTRLTNLLETLLDVLPDQLRAEAEAALAEHAPAQLAESALMQSVAQRLRFPTMLRKMWSGGEVQAWIDERLGTSAPASTRKPAQHSDDWAVDRFAHAMKAKLAKAREKGRDGWDDPGLCSPYFLAELFVGHLSKRNEGNLVDLANLAMMLHERGAAPELLVSAVDKLKIQAVFDACQYASSKLSAEGSAEDFCSAQYEWVDRLLTGHVTEEPA